MRQEFHDLIERLIAGNERVLWDDFRREFVLTMTDGQEGEEERKIILSLFCIFADGVEKLNDGWPNYLRRIRAERRQDYGYVLLNEAIDADGRIDPMKWAEITTREVVAGHLDEDDPFHILAVSAGSYVRAGRHLPPGGSPRN
jgi:hypothetical protein